jgi:hypothetical protein
VFAAASGGPLAAEAISGSLAGLVSRRLRSRKSRSRLLRGSTRSSADEPAEHKITTTNKQRNGTQLWVFNSVLNPRHFGTNRNPNAAIFVIDLQDANKKLIF